MNPQRTLVWTLCAKLGFVTTDVKAALLELAAQQLKFYQSGGKAVASGTVGGESVSFNVPSGFSVGGMSELCRVAYREITDLTNSELEDYALEEDIEGVRPDFGAMGT